jgi:hypothetical protein
MGLPRMLCSRPGRSIAGERQAMAFLWFLLGVLIGLFGLVLLPLLVGVLGAAAALGFVVLLPLALAVVIVVGFLAVAPTIGYGLAIAAVLILLWASDRNRRQRR